MKHLVAGAIAVAVCTTSYGADWQHAGLAEKAAFSIDRESVRQVGPMVKVWVMANLTAPRSMDSRPANFYTSLKHLYYFECDAFRYNIVHEVLYTGTDGQGDIVNSQGRPFDEEDLSDVVPETINEALLKKACDIAKKKNAKHAR